MNSKKKEAHMSNDERIAILETTILNINSALLDIKQEMRRSFDRIDHRFDAIENKFIGIDHKFDAMDKKFIGIDNKFESKLDAMDKKFESKLDAMDKKFEGKIDALDKKFDSKFDALQNRMMSHFFWLLSMIIGLAGLIAHAQHWI